jgi:hypothetical protein
MFKNYLTYSFVLNFQRSCLLLKLPDETSKASLLASAEKMAAHFARSLQFKTAPEQAKALCVALLCLRDCGKILRQSGHSVMSERSAWIEFEVLETRLEQLLGAATETRNRVSAPVKIG